MRRAFWWVAFGAALLVAVPPAAAARFSPAAQRGRDLVVKHECNRCHEFTSLVPGDLGLRPAKHKLHCTHCHQDILSTRDKPAEIAKWKPRYPDWDRFLEHIVHYVEVPDLGTLTRRVDPVFLRAYLDAPFDLRPDLEESMIPVRMTAPEKDDVVAYLTELGGARVTHVDRVASAVPPERLAAGKKAFGNASCPSCHLFGNTRFSKDVDAAFYVAMRAKARLAPNLRFVRQRMSRKTLVAWILNPTDVVPSAMMPPQKVDAKNAELIADFLLHGDFDVDKTPAPTAVPDVPILARTVTFEEVQKIVFRDTCVHCHGDPTLNKEAGPGSTGGLGFVGVRLTLNSHEGLMRGLVRDGKTLSIVSKGQHNEPPLLLQALLRRHAEASRDVRPPFADRIDLGTGPGDRPGMPMGLPPVSVDKLSLVKTWLEQGARPPTHPVAQTPGMDSMNL